VKQTKSLPIHVVVLAAGRSTRMKSQRNKLVHPVRGLPVLSRSLANVRQLGDVVCVVGKESPDVAEVARAAGARIVVQDPPKGTGHALMVAREALGEKPAHLLIVSGDVPLADPEALAALLRFHKDRGAIFTVLSTEPPEPGRYGRVVRRGSRLLAIAEFLDATERQLAIREINSGIYCARIPDIYRYLDRLVPDNQKGEYYLTDLVSILVKSRQPVSCMFHPAWREWLGVNTRADLAECEAILNARKVRSLQLDGVGILSAANTIIGDDVEIGPDTIVHPFTCIEGKTKIGSRCTILPFSRIVDSTLSDDVAVLGSSLIVETAIDCGVSVGPFCHLRGGSRILEGSKVGNFVEMKKTTFGPRSKAMHLSYLGDATIESEVNIGAGTITCNYDGVKKNPTHIEKGVFVGSGTELVAPVKIGRGSYVAAGSTVTEDVPPDSLAIARARQKNKVRWVEKRRKQQGHP